MKLHIQEENRFKIKSLMVVVVFLLSLASSININANFSEVNRENEELNTNSAEPVLPVKEKYKYAYENDFDYYYHFTDVSEGNPILTAFPSGINTEWSQDATDDNKLEFDMGGVLNPWDGNFVVLGSLLVESHNTFEPQSNPYLGAYIDWSFDLNLEYHGIDALTRQCYISLMIATQTGYEELITIEDFNPQEGTYYLANFKNYILSDGKIKFSLACILVGTTLWYADYSSFWASMDFNGLRVVQEIKPKENDYVYENNFDYLTHATQTQSLFWSDIIAEDLIGENTEWSQNPNDADNLKLSYTGGFTPLGGIPPLPDAYMQGYLIIESHNTFIPTLNPGSGVYIDWCIDFDILFEGIVPSVQLSLVLYKSDDFEEFVTIGDQFQLEGSSYLPNFNQFIWSDGKVRLALVGLASGFTILGADASWIYESIEIKGLRFVQEIKPVKSVTEKRTLILVHGFACTDPITAWATYRNTLEFKKAYDKIIIMNYYGDFCAYRYSKDEYGVWHQDSPYSLGLLLLLYGIPLPFTADHPIETIAFAFALYIMQDLNYIGENVDIVCHSMGGLVTRYMIKYYYDAIKTAYWDAFGRIFTIHSVCTVGTPNHGVIYGWLVPVTQTIEMGPLSPFLIELNNFLVYPGTEIPLSGIYINWFTYRGGPYILEGARADGIVETISVPILSTSGEVFATNRGIFNVDHGVIQSGAMVNNVVFNDLFDPPEIIETIFNEATPGKIVEIEDLTLEGGSLTITFQPDTASDMDPTSVAIELDTTYQLELVEGTLDTYEVELELEVGDYSFLITANDLEGRLYQISGTLNVLPPDITPPVITIISPMDGLITNGDVTLEYTVEDDVSIFSEISISGPPSGTPYSAEGFYDITITAIDKAGNSATASVSFTIDKTAPVINFIQPEAGYYNTEQIVEWEVIEEHPDMIIATHPSGTVFDVEGTYTVSVEATDQAGNFASKSLTLVLDKTAPIITITGPTEGYYNTDQTVEWEVSDEYLYGESANYPSPTTFTEDGIYQVTVSATDLAGNTATASSAEFVIDKTPPVITINGPDAGYYNTPQTVTWTVDEANIEQIIYNYESGTTFDSDGTYQVTITVIDLAGNMATASSAEFTIDTTPPEITITGPATGYYNTPQTVTWSVDDLYIDEVSCIYDPETTFNSDGIYQVVVTARDLAGNMATASSAEFTIDMTPPVITIMGPSEGYYNSPQTVVWNVEDLNLDFVTSNYDPETTFDSDGTYQVIVTATDLAGNSATASSAEFVIDLTNPVTSISIGQPHFTINDVIHLTSTTPIELIASEIPGGSGIAKTYYKISDYSSDWQEYDGIFTLEIPDGAYSLEYYSIDEAGNEESIKSIAIYFDSTSPFLDWEDKGKALQDGYRFTIEADDATGVTELTVSIKELNGPVVADIPISYIGGNLWKADDLFETTSLPDGYYELIVEATDKFGYVTLEEFPFSIRNWAVLVLLPSTESNKAGRTMPVKFALRVIEEVDPAMPFVVNQELDIFITDLETGLVLQHSIYGDGSKNYRINYVSEHYITNFKTHKTPTTYLVSISRHDFLIGDFSFSTHK